MKYLKHILILIFLTTILIILKKDFFEKFNQNLESPEILEIVKEKTKVNLKFLNNSNKEKEYIIFYIDVNKPHHGIWVQKKILCKDKICNIKLEELNGIRYHLTILERSGKHMSKIKDIIKFGDKDPFIPHQIKENKKILFPEIKNIILSPSPDESKDTDKTDKLEEVDAPNPYIDCNGKPHIKNINYDLNRDKIDDIEIKSECDMDEEIERLKRKNKRSLWDEFKMGYLSVDFKL
tara:strand:- start:248 stop:955 length:708 start_codon:yes stop_codon:yes gene_type:complete